MRIVWLLLFLSKSLMGFSQLDFASIDTSSITICKNDLSIEFKKKFESINKNLNYPNTAERNIIKEIFEKTQSDFLERISNNDFLCSSDLNLYLQRLLNEILTKNKIDATDYKILLSKDSEVNAANMGNGVVVVNYGIFLAVENEDELVFVISHEIGHQCLNHVKQSIEKYAKLSTSKEIIEKTKEIQKQKFGKASKANDLLKNLMYQNYSQRRKKEIAADSLGLTLYLKTFRNPKASITLLEKLNVSDEEKDSLTVADYKLIFEQKGFKIKEKFFQQEESLFKQYDGEKQIETDSLKSHPDCITRIQLIKKQLNDTFKINETKSTDFDQIKKNSITQNLLNLYFTKSYGQSLYETLKLYKNDKENALYKHLIFLNLTEIQKSKSNYTINRYVPSYDNKYNTPSLNRFVSFLNNIKISDFDTIINNFKP
ncbi:M48 family metallopeptidase [Flavobacterium buctense]|uniref:M48 family metallopeptidase n=1 Tax=Flavobacterium buctense TaxID=1648146 RepID=A0ABU9DWT9_9FLAO|nr:M48 family metallopeptidase [Flavobacterium buctense]